MKTIDEIIKEITQDTSILGFRTETLIQFLTFEQAKPFLIETAKKEDWKDNPLTEESVKEQMKKYMEFAWTKVEDHRGLSANRSIEKMEAFLWILEDDKTLAKVKETGYAQYGAPKLKVICERYGFHIPMSSKLINMMEGKLCVEGCEEGCGM